MANSNLNNVKQAPDKKLNRMLIEQKLEETFAELRSAVGKKKFERRMKKAGKLISNSFPKKAMDSFRKNNDTIKNTQSDVNDAQDTGISDLV